MARVNRLNPVPTFLAAGVLGAAIGVAPEMLVAEGRRHVDEAVRGAAASLGATRSREPRSGDFWRGCDDARAARTAPIYRGEPGYRSKMDGDDDGIACEPYYG